MFFHGKKLSWAKKHPSISLYFKYHSLGFTVEPRSNGPAFNGIPPLTDTISWSLEPIFIYFLYWL